MKSILLFILFFANLVSISGQNRVIIPPTDEYKKHLKAAKSHKTSLIENKKQLTKYVNAGKLVKVKQRGYGYRIDKLTHSHSYLVPKGNNVLKDIAREFVRETGQNFFVVTSLTRTLDDQNRLRKVNLNASSNDSAHNFGASFDISYVRFNHKLAVNNKLDKELNKVLALFEKYGKIYYVKEKKSKCYHIVVR